MRTLPLEAVFQDGSVPDEGEPLAPYAQGIAIQQWTDCRLDVTCLGADGVAFDIAGGALLLSAKVRPSDEEPTLSFEATIDDGPNGLAHFTVGSVDSGIDARSYGYVIVFTDADGYIWPVVAEGTLTITPSEYVPGQEVTVSESQAPLAEGPGFTDRGAYAGGTTYAPRDVVTYEVDDVTSTYACILASTGNAPTDDTYWELWASGAEFRDNGTFLWAMGVGFDVFWATVDIPEPNYGIILVESPTDPSGEARTIPAGSYDFSRVIFRALPRVGINTGATLITLASGVLLDAGDYVGLHLDGPFSVTASAALMTPSAKQVALTFANGARLRTTTDVTLFDSSCPGATGRHIVRSLHAGGLSSASGATNPAFYINSATGIVTVESRGVGLGGVCFSSGGTFAATFGGLSGATVSALVDPLSFFTTSDVASPVALTTTSSTCPLYVPRVAALPTAAAIRVGQTFVVPGGTGVADQAHVCRKKADGSYEWAQITPGTTVTGAEAIPAGALIVVDRGATASRYGLFTTGMDPARIVGAAITACSGAASTFLAQLVDGIATSLLSDGTGTVGIGMPVGASLTVDGRVLEVADGDPTFLGYNVGPAVAATLDAEVVVL